MTEPLRLSFEVFCPLEHAFAVWTERIGSWWPADHSVSADPDLVVLLEGRTGGRLYERRSDGVEHDWGAVTRWEPPTRLGYSWHLGRRPDQATEVEIRFLPLDDHRTRVEIEHRGWERLGPSAPEWRDRNRLGWETLLPHFVAAVDGGDHRGRSPDRVGRSSQLRAGASRVSAPARPPATTEVPDR